MITSLSSVSHLSPLVTIARVHVSLHISIRLLWFKGISQEKRRIVISIRMVTVAAFGLHD
jgi:hypothetical protein